MKNKWIGLGVVSAMVIVSGFYFFYFLKAAPAPAMQTVNDLPMLSITQVDGSTVFLRDVQNKVVLIFFNPDCDHCQREAKLISEQKQIFKNHLVYFISNDEMANIQKFAIDYNLLDGNFHFARAEGAEVYRAMGPMPSVPAIFIYDNYKLVKRLEGEVKLEEVMKYL